MEYVIPVVLVLVIVAAAITAFVMNSQRKSSGRRDAVAADAGHTGGPGMGLDQTPLGDTAEHAGTQARDGETVEPPDAVAHGGTGHPVSHYGASVPPERERELQAELDEAAASEGVDPDAARREGIAPKGIDEGRDRGGPPESERIADRPA